MEPVAARHFRYRVAGGAELIYHPFQMARALSRRVDKGKDANFGSYPRELQERVEVKVCIHPFAEVLSYRLSLRG